jgi:hypothetical protein
METGINWDQLRTAIVIFIAAVLVGGCGSSVKVRSDYDPGVDMRQYKTYNFFSQMGIEGDNYSNLYGQHFRAAISEQMEARGYVKSDNPDLQINVTAAADEKVRVNTYSDPYLYGGYYGGYRGYYDPWYGHGGGTRTTVHQYTEANIYIDLVDGKEHKMVWQGVATFTVTDKMQREIRQSISNTVSEIFGAYPIPRPGA